MRVDPRGSVWVRVCIRLWVRVRDGPDALNSRPRVIAQCGPAAATWRVRGDGAVIGSRCQVPARLIGGPTVTRKDWTLLVITAAGGRPVSPVQLQKALFLLGENLDPDQLGVETGFYEFEPYDYGPFDGAIYNDAETLEVEGLVTIEANRRFREYCATPAGLEVGMALRRRLDPAAPEYLDRLVGWVRSLTFNALVQAIYRKYPAMAANSVFRP
jgi:hypothetical protein